MTESPKMNMSRFDGMSTETLKDILYQDFFLQENEGYGADEILYISGLVAEREKPGMDSEYPDAGEEWEIFAESYLPTAGEESLYGDESAARLPVRDNAVKKKRTGLSRILPIAAVLAAILAVFTVTASAMGYSPFKAVATWTKDIFSFSISVPVTEELQAEMDKMGITEFSAPGYIPEGFKQMELDSVYMGKYHYLGAFYNDDSDNIISVIVIRHYDDTLKINYSKDEGSPELIEQNGVKYYHFTNAGRNVVVWESGGVEYGISSDLSREEVLKMAYSMS
jgi:hypothetical protein